MNDPREAQFLELLEADTLSPDDWDTLDRLSRELDLTDPLDCHVAEAFAELEFGLFLQPLH